MLVDILNALLIVCLKITVVYLPTIIARKLCKFRPKDDSLTTIFFFFACSEITFIVLFANWLDPTKDKDYPHRPPLLKLPTVVTSCL